MRILIKLAENKQIPDVFIRFGIRQLCRLRLKLLYQLPTEQRFAAQMQLYAELRKQALALATEQANQQHYELPAEFFTKVLGPNRKYSGCYWSDGVSNLAAAEHASLVQICQRAEIEDGQTILELGCGWGSLSLWLSRNYPNSQILAISNSDNQQAYIKNICNAENIKNLALQKADINFFTTDKKFDRVVSVEMFEHIRNHSQLLKNINQWLKEDGKLFFHIFCHKELTYLFEEQDESDWLTRYFFTGGMMPAFTYPLYWQHYFKLEQQWYVNGAHYQKTAEAWLINFDSNLEFILTLFEHVYGKNAAKLWLQRWRMFFMACAELFGYRDGEEWHIGHYLFTPSTSNSSSSQAKVL